MSLPTAVEVKAERDAALKRVDRAADPDWKDRAYQAIVTTARTEREFISDDVWRITGLEPPREARALGPVFLRASRDGLIRKTGRVSPSIRSHLSGKPIWESLIFGSLAGADRAVSASASELEGEEDQSSRGTESADARGSGSLASEQLDIFRDRVLA